MEIIESSIIGKKNQDACEDGLVVTDDFVAVIDGSTSKTPLQLSPDMKNGRYAMNLISQYIAHELLPDASMEDFCKGVSSYIYNNVYAERNVVERMRLHPEERLTAVAAIYSQARKEVWMVGDCQVMIDGRLYDNSKAYESEIAQKRVDLIKQGISPKEARKAIEPLLIAAMQEGQNQIYAVIDGFPICLSGVRVIPLSSISAKEIVLASDGYPFLKPTLVESEEALRQQLDADPQNIHSFLATKGLVEGNKSFDDRTYVRISL